MDDLEYYYENTDNSNKLSYLKEKTNGGNANSGYPLSSGQQGQTIIYDDNGNMTTQADKGISSIAYNFLNLPAQVIQNGVTTQYIYRADGTKLKKTYGTGKVTDYLDGFQYELENGVAKLQFVPTGEGYYDFVKNLYIYNYVDHLGNTRLSYTKNSAGVLEILEENNYYPFGLKHSGYNNITGATTSYQYKFQSQELQETGFYSFKWRNYMPDVGRFFNVDLLAEKYDDYTPYQFSSNQPIHAKELEGLESSNDLNKRASPQQRAISDKRVQEYAAAARKSFSNVFNGNLSVKPKFGGLGGDVGVTLGPLKGHLGGAVAKVEGSLNTQKPSIKVKAEGLSAEGSLGIKNAKMEGSIAAISMEGEGTLKNGKPSGEFKAEGGKVESKITNGNISLDLTDLKVGGDVKVFKALHIGVEVNFGEAINGTVNTINMVLSLIHI